MSLDKVLPYFRAKLNALDLNEHDDAFDFDTVAESLLSDTYGLEWGSGSETVRDVNHYTYTQPVTTRIWVCGTRDALATRDRAIVIGESAVNTLMSFTVDNPDDVVKNISLGGFTIEPLSDSNDNDMIIVIDTAVTVYLCILT